jgi:PAS domain S-box-containing protein
MPRMKELDLFEQLQEEGPIGLVIGGSDFKFIGVNPFFCEMLGYTEQELVGKSFRDLTYVEDIPHSEKAKIDFLERRMPVRYEKRYQRKDGTLLPVRVTNYPSYESCGEYTFSFGVIEPLIPLKK